MEAVGGGEEVDNAFFKSRTKTTWVQDGPAGRRGNVLFSLFFVAQRKRRRGVCCWRRSQRKRARRRSWLCWGAEWSDGAARDSDKIGRRAGGHQLKLYTDNHGLCAILRNAFFIFQTNETTDGSESRQPIRTDTCAADSTYHLPIKW